MEKYLTNVKYYSSINNSKKKIKKSDTIKTLDGNIKSPFIQDDYRRAIQFKNFSKNKNILDFGCGWGGFLKASKNCKTYSGIEVRTECLNYIQKNIKKIKLSDNINDFDKEFDLITMFHVLEHMPYQVDTLKILKSKLKKGGKIIIEVPHAKDFLILQEDLKEFKNFTFWSEHLVLHTLNSLKTILLKSGFRKINIQFYQRYNFANHLGWFIKKKPGGHEFFKNLTNDKLNQSYKNNLERLGQTDTLIAVAE